MTHPIETITPVTIANAINTSIIVKPASDGSVGKWRARDNLDPSGQPVDANFVGTVEVGQCNRPAATHAVCKKTDRRKRSALPTGLRQQRIESHVVGHADRFSGRSRAD